MRLAVLVATALLGLWVLWRVRVVLMPFVFALAIAYLLSPAVRACERRGLPTWLAILTVYAALAATVFGVGSLVVPHMVAEGRELLRALPALADRLERLTAVMFAHYRSLPLPDALRAQSDAWIAGADQRLAGALRAVLRGMAGGMPVLASLVVSPFLAYYVLRDRRRFAVQLWRAVPRRRRRTVHAVVHTLDRAVGGFVRGQILVSLCIGLMALGVSLLFRLPFPLFIALVAAATDVIPYLGPLLGALPAVTFAFLHAPWEAVWVLAIFLAMHEFEGVVLSPWILGNEVGMHPLVVFLAILVGGDLFGFAGMLLAVPAAATLGILGAFAYEELRAWAARGPRPRLRPRRLRGAAAIVRFSSAQASGRMGVNVHPLRRGATGSGMPGSPRGTDGA